MYAKPCPRCKQQPTVSQYHLEPNPVEFYAACMNEDCIVFHEPDFPLEYWNGLSRKDEDDVMKRITEYARELALSDYRGQLANWNREYEALMQRKPMPPEKADDLN